MEIERRLEELGLTLPAPMRLPPGVNIPFAWVRVRGDRAYVSGHGALQPDGALAGPFGSVPSEVSPEQAQASCRLTALAVLASLKTALGDLDRVTAWLAVHGFVNADPGYPRTTLALNPLSELIVGLYGPDRGAHARTAIGVAALPFNLPVIAAAEVEIA
jgi:enamine deaminase RidA (YjgF/YER057c/UK114 family)